MTSKSKNVASLLAIFLGSFGAHRFYLRSYGLGVLYLLFCWTLIPGILGIFEGIRYLLMNEKKFYAKYAQESASTEDTDSEDIPRSLDDRNERTETDPNMEVSVNFEEFSEGSRLDTMGKLDQSMNTWAPPGEMTTLNGYEISDGMVYVGTELSGSEGYYGTDACLINPTLETDATKLDPDGIRMSYWPSYSGIDPGCRATYLEWLMNGRRDPDIDIGYVFLFFYGLERRVFFDGQYLDTARSEIPHLINEVQELLEIYGEEGSFQRYATGFLNAARARYDPESLITVDQSRRREVPLGLQIKIGRQIVKGESITPNLAYEWFLQAPDTYLRTPAQRCKDAFKDLFFARYEQRFSGGFTLEPNKTPLTVSYRPASRSIPQQEDIEIDGLPDISVLSAPLQKLQEIANECCTELDSYSRYVGKSQDRDSLEALSYLPQPILERRQTDSSTEFLRTIENELGSSDIAETNLDLFLKQWPIESGTKVRKRDLRRLISLCEKLGFGIEPDVRFTTPSRGWGDPAVLYRLPPETSQESTAVTEAVRLIQKLAIIIVQANDEVSPEETQYLAENLGSFLELSESDRVRLDAHRRWLILDSPTLHGVRQRAEDLPDDQKTQIANFLTALACSDGNIDPKEIQELSKIYPMLGLDEEMVHTHLHQLQTQPAEADNEPVTIRKQESTSDEYEIPDPEGSEEPQTTEFELDRERVNRTLEESQEVSDFLADIFEEDEEDDTQPESQQLEQQEHTSDPTDIATESLDENHRQFLITLSQKQQWDRDEVEDVARDIGLFPGAAMEVVNDYAFELVETPVIEGADEIIINQDVSSKILE